MSYYTISPIIPPEPNKIVHIKVAENDNNVGGGAAMYGTDGKWYWVQVEEMPYEVLSWSNLPKEVSYK